MTNDPHGAPRAPRHPLEPTHGPRPVPFTATTAWRPALGQLAILLAVALPLACGGGNGGTDKSAASAAKPAATAAADQTPAPAPAEPLGTASIHGTVTFEGDVPTIPTIKMDADPVCHSKHDQPVAAPGLELGEGKTLGDVFVRVKWQGDQPLPPPAEPVVMDQHGCMYQPHVMGVQVGQKFEIENSDGLLHNVHSLSKVNPQFNRAMPANVKEASYTFDKQEFMFHVKCDVHPWMSAYVTVTDNPFFAVTGKDGKYEIGGLPAGTYELEAWQEKLGTRTATVTVADGESTSADFTFSR